MTGRLYTYWRSSAAYRVRIALNLKGLEWEQTPIDLRSGVQNGADYGRINPQNLVPLWVEEAGSLAQSLAIIEYLNELYPTPPLLPQDPLRRAQARAAAYSIACDIHPVNNLRVLTYLKAHHGADQVAADTWARHWITLGFTALEETARAHGGPYLLGDQLTLADVCLVPQMYNARRVDTDLTPFPQLQSIDAALTLLPAFRDAAPERQPDAPRAS
jgi:maleylacetoacetate isomerase/maleylpyruvate isomerase